MASAHLIGSHITSMGVEPMLADRAAPNRTAGQHRPDASDHDDSNEEDPPSHREETPPVTIHGVSVGSCQDSSRRLRVEKLDAHLLERAGRRSATRITGSLWRRPYDSERSLLG
jgi:hypothetical protein